MADQELRLEWIDPKTLTPNPSNWRVHPPAQREALQGVLEEVGWAGALLWNESTGRLVDGHLRLDVALRENRESVPVLIGTWTEAQEKEILAILDPIAAMAEADSAQLDALLRDVNSGSAAVMDMLAGLAEDAGVIPSNWENAFSGVPDGDKAPFQQMTFTLHDSQAERVKEAIERAKDEMPDTDTNANSNGNALAYLCEVYLDG